MCSFFSIHIWPTLDCWALTANGSTLTPPRIKAATSETDCSFAGFSTLRWTHLLETIALDVSGLMSGGLGAYLSAQPFQHAGCRLLILSFCSLSVSSLKTADLGGVNVFSQDPHRKPLRLLVDADIKRLDLLLLSTTGSTLKNFKRFGAFASGCSKPGKMSTTHLKALRTDLLTLDETRRAVGECRPPPRPV